MLLVAEVRLTIVTFLPIALSWASSRGRLRARIEDAGAARSHPREM